jgi:NAD(P)H-hydrate epimerase
MRASDKRAINEFQIPGLILMESAALRVVDSIESKFPVAIDPFVVVLCGKGNNGGDGFAVARHLCARGYRVAVALLAEESDITGDAAQNLKLLKAFPVAISGLESVQHVPSLLSKSDLIVDALFGTGFKGPARSPADGVIKAINGSKKPVLSIDIPSGLNADTGTGDGGCVCANWTVTFVAPKIGLLLFPGAQNAGTIEVVSIGMPEQILAESDAQCAWLTADTVAAWLPARVRGRDANKGTYGHVALFAGGHGYLGAAQIGAEAAARMGAGLVTLATSNDALGSLQARLNPVIMTRSLPSTDKGTIGLAGLNAALELATTCKTAAVGPGLAISHCGETADFAVKFIEQCSVPIVIDADAIVALSQLPDRGVSVTAKRSSSTIMTPHPGEMAKLLGTDTKSIQSDRPGAVLRAAREYNAIVVLKGDRSLIASPDGTWYINSTGNPGMATGGSGDALTGIIAALLAQGLTAPIAAAAGVFLHGLAGDCAVKRRGAREGLIATDLIDSLGEACAEMRKSEDGAKSKGVIYWEN